MLVCIYIYVYIYTSPQNKQDVWQNVNAIDGRFAGAYKSVSVKRSADMLQAILRFILTAHIFRKGTYIDLHSFVRIIKLLLFD